jgi:hypothetical protein
VYCKVQKEAAHRYDLEPHATVNVFVPRMLSTEVADTPYKIPATQFGAMYKQSGLSYEKLPKSAGKVCWEVEVKTEVPKMVKPLKPKLWFMGTATLHPGLAYKVS